MITQVDLPQIELTMENAIVIQWLVKEGDTVSVEQSLVEVETQKATSDVPSPVAGVVRRICVREGETVAAKAVLCIISTTPDEPLEVDAGSSVPAASPVDSDKEDVASSPTNTVGNTSGKGSMRASPAARKAARELGVDLKLVRGTGPSGRISVEDVEAFASTRDSSPNGRGWTDMTPTRIALIAQMQKSLQEIPQIVITRRIDVTPLFKNQEGITFTHRLTRQVAVALERHPNLRTMVDGRRMKVFPVSVAVAIETANGLVAPVLREGDLRSVDVIASRIVELRERAGRGALKNDELKDGPFAITNLGMQGVDFFTPFVFHGQTAVLAVGRAMDRTGGKTAWFSLAADHRVVDGAEAARFLNTLQQEILS